MGSKHEVILDIFYYCRKRNNFVFDNELVKEICKKHGFGNPFDVTKLDDTSKFPQRLLDEDYFILHLGGGKHKFVKGISNGFRTFEKIDTKSVYDWKYRKSILNELDTSESNILSVANNQRIINDFLYKEIVVNPKVYNPRRTKISITYYINKDEIKARNVQMEIDLTIELDGVVTIFEVKNGFPKDFAIYQLYNPFKYYSIIKKKLDIKLITCCYILRDKVEGESILRLYNYTFTEENNMSSIKLLKSAQYNLIKR